MKVQNPIGLNRLILAMLLPLVAFVLQSIFWAAIKPFAWFLFFPAVFFSSWIGGLSGAVIATVISTALAWWAFIPPEHSFALEDPSQIGSIGLFMVMGVLFGYSHERIKKANRETREALAAVSSAKDQLETRVRERTAELAQINESLQTSEARMAGIVDSAIDAIISVDSGQKIVLFNAGAEEIFRCPAGKAIGQPIDMFIPQRFREQHRQHVQGFGQTGVASRSMSSRGPLSGLRADGGEFPIEASISQIEVAGQKLFTVILRDITERKRVEKEVLLLQTLTHSITESESLDSAIAIALRKICESTGWNVGEAWIPSQDNAYLVCNPSWYCNIENVEPFRKTSEQYRFSLGIGLPGRVWLSRKPAWIPDVTKDSNFPRAPFAQKAGLKAGVGIPVLADNEVIAVMDFFIREAREEDERLVKLVSAVATQLGTSFQRKQAEEGLKKTLIELERSNKELEQFAYVASHDLQEPLRMVSSFTQLLARRYKDKLDADADDFIAYAVNGANRMQQLINDLLMYSRVGTRGKPLEPCDVHSILGEVLVNLQPTIGESHAIITNDGLPTVIADPSQLVQLFQNLISNAIRFRGDEAPRIHISAEEKPAEWLFSVRDNGIGIAPEYRERIFVIFQRLQPQSHQAGTGIGLAICKRIAERHGGKIWMESEPGRGSTFYFTISKRKGEERP